MQQISMTKLEFPELKQPKFKLKIKLRQMLIVVKLLLVTRVILEANPP